MSGIKENDSPNKTEIPYDSKERLDSWFQNFMGSTGEEQDGAEGVFCYYGKTDPIRIREGKERIEKETGRILEEQEAMNLFLNYCVENMPMLLDEALENGKIR